MGGTTQFGEFYTWDAAKKMIEDSIKTYQEEIGLFLRTVQVTYSDETKKWSVAMRFTK